MDVEVVDGPHKKAGYSHANFYGATKDRVGKGLVEISTLFLMTAMNTDSNLMGVDLFNCIDYHL